jgi:hypothetical protein
MWSTELARKLKEHRELGLGEYAKVFDEQRKKLRAQKKQADEQVIGFAIVVSVVGLLSLAVAGTMYMQKRWGVRTAVFGVLLGVNVCLLLGYGLAVGKLKSTDARRQLESLDTFQGWFKQQNPTDETTWRAVQGLYDREVLNTDVREYMSATLDLLGFATYRKCTSPPESSSSGAPPTTVGEAMYDSVRRAFEVLEDPEGQGACYLLTDYNSGRVDDEERLTRSFRRTLETQGAALRGQLAQHVTRALESGDDPLGAMEEAMDLLVSEMRPGVLVQLLQDVLPGMFEMAVKEAATTSGGASAVTGGLVLMNEEQVGVVMKRKCAEMYVFRCGMTTGQLLAHATAYQSLKPYNSLTKRVERLEVLGYYSIGLLFRFFVIEVCLWLSYSVARTVSADWVRPTIALTIVVTVLGIMVSTLVVTRVRTEAEKLRTREESIRNGMERFTQSLKDMREILGGKSLDALNGRRLLKTARDVLEELQQCGLRPVEAATATVKKVPLLSVSLKAVIVVVSVVTAMVLWSMAQREVYAARNGIGVPAASWTLQIPAYVAVSVGVCGAALLLTISASIDIHSYDKDRYRNTPCASLG